ncbi:MAG: TetR/AcrR family transcriptional regulator [Pseudomonadota bacterium]
MDEPLTNSPPKANSAQNRDKRATVGALIKAAREQLVSEGITKASVLPILSRAGVSRGALFHHFPTKKHLIAAAFDDLMQTAATQLHVLGIELRLSIIDLETFVDGLREIYCSDVFIGSMEIALNNRVDPAMSGLIENTIENWWIALGRFWNETFELPGQSASSAEQHWVMAANLLRGHAFTTIYRNSDTIRSDFCTSFQEMILKDAKLLPFEDRYELLAEDLKQAVGFRLLACQTIEALPGECVYSFTPESSPSVPLDQSVLLPTPACLLDLEEPWIGNNATDLARMFPDIKLPQKAAVGCCVVVPVRVNHKTIGSLIIFDEAIAYTAEDAAKAALFARRAARLLTDESPNSNSKD